MRHLLLVLIASLLTGCDSSPEGELAGKSEVNGYSFTLLGEGGNVMTRSSGAGTQVTLGKDVVGLDEESGAMTFNGKAAGTIAKGDQVIVDARGRLFVNGKRR